MENSSNISDKQYPSREYSGLEEIVKEFLAADKVTAACFGVPGPVRDGRLRLTNLPWTLDGRELAADLAIDHVFLINDLEANGYGLAELSGGQIFTLNQGDASQIGNRALLSAGTGLGECYLVWNGHQHIPYPSEGGHADYAPRNEDEIDLLRYLKQKFNGRISVERVVSGPGLITSTNFCARCAAWKSRPGSASASPTKTPTPSSPNLPWRPAARSAKRPWICFVSAYGAEAGNLALKFLSVGGLYVGGGIAPRIVEKLKDGTFMKAFTDKGRLSQLLINMPVRIILESRAALLGAAAYAEARAAEISGISPRAASVKI